MDLIVVYFVNCNSKENEEKNLKFCQNMVGSGYQVPICFDGPDLPKRKFARKITMAKMLKYHPNHPKN